MQTSNLWPNNTRHKQIRLAAQTETANNPRTWEIPKSGILAGIYLQITGTIATGTSLSNLNPLGFSSIVRRVRLIANSGIAIIDVSGPGYAYLLQDQFELGLNFTQNDGKTAISATTYDISMFFPISINSRDPIGLIMLQNEQTSLRLEVEFEANANIATGISTHTNTVQPLLEIFTVPVDPKNWPSFDFLHVMQEEQTTVSASGEYQYIWPRGNTYVSLFHGYGIDTSPTDEFTQYRLRVNQSDYLYDWNSKAIEQNWERYHSSARPLGVIPVDFIGYSGMGNYGSARDLFDSAQVTDIASVITASSARTLYTMKRQLINLG